MPQVTAMQQKSKIGPGICWRFRPRRRRRCRHWRRVLSATYLEAHPDVNLADLCYTAAVGRNPI